MNAVSIVSSTDPSVSISLSGEVREHLRRHFSNELPGSKFNSEGPEQLLQMVLDLYPKDVAAAVPDGEGIKIVSLRFRSEIGTSNVVPISELTDEECTTMRTVPRGETLARCVESDRLFPTNECQLILDADNNLITAYPGELAPPLPPTPDVHDPYWDNHVFIVPKSREKE